MVFSSIPPVREKGSSRGGCNLQSNTWLCIVKSLWVRMRGTDRHGYVVVDACYKLPKHEEEVNEAFVGQMEEAS